MKRKAYRINKAGSLDNLKLVNEELPEPSSNEVTIKVKLLNSTMNVPDDRSHLPSSEPVLLEIPVSLKIDETKLIPFNWSIENSFALEKTTHLDLLVINKQNKHTKVSSQNNYFKLVFELWIFDQDVNKYVFGWYSKDEFYSASIYIWFTHKIVMQT